VRARELVRLGNTQVTVTRLGFGTTAIGNLFEAVTREAALTALSRGWELGIRLFDTAPLYGYGVAEERLGQFCRTHPRQEVTISTKVGRRLEPDPEGHRTSSPFVARGNVAPRFDFTFDGVMRCVEESLARLGVDAVDILHIHDPDAHLAEAVSGAYAALTQLRLEGVTRAISVGMNHAQPLAHMAREADFDCLLLAGRYTLLDHLSALQLLDDCETRGIPIIIGGVYNSGILASMQGDTGGTQGHTTFDYIQAPAEVVTRAQLLNEICERYGVPLKAVAIQFPLAHGAVASVLVGCRSAREVEDNVEMFDTPVPPELWFDLRAAGLLGPAVPIPTS
jgi:D-threo-aldose 1-dehydrogenase